VIQARVCVCVCARARAHVCVRMSTAVPVPRRNLDHQTQLPEMSDAGKSALAGLRVGEPLEQPE